MIEHISKKFKILSQNETYDGILAEAGGGYF